MQSTRGRGGPGVKSHGKGMRMTRRFEPNHSFRREGDPDESQSNDPELELVERSKRNISFGPTVL